LKSHIGDDEFCSVSDITNAWAMLGVMGPDSRALLSDAIDHDFTTENFPFGDFQPVELGMARAFAGRVSYVGELGWELYVPVDQARHAFDYLWEKGQGHG
ncbi:MAG: FAD-dependent oxidoreductase, partial [Gammaproteobacteria bacterium]|nr:FAD-dependent oxidoreductase [Gammaproteobacteria bacterium]NIO26543.1 FAD-dependent oxidoreductase [Gammaproteobacteria bacterium]